ncbi:hypothetical protein VTK73DRAFT_8542 [Phialemonium thermophilum]|uniref:Uncharacterized protein n=1 Tax=Phialemonium thermophilum TaxID=223376 RepID=A0ABR3W7Z5_9PEZI
MVQYVFTPWRDRRELLMVRRQLYPNKGRQYETAPPHVTGSDGGRDDGQDSQRRQQQEQQHAVARVSMWMQRGNCPHLIESTALLLAAILSDLHGSGSDSLSWADPVVPGLHLGLDGSVPTTTSVTAYGGYAARAAYSAAFSRFVTGLLDSNQDKQRKMSMYAVAKAVGLPATFVELRHQATHEQLPSLTRLRAAALAALDWIWDYYWKHVPGDGPGNDGSAGGNDETDVMVVVDGEGQKQSLSAAREPIQGASPGSDPACKKQLEICLSEEDPDARQALLAGIRRRFADAQVLRALGAIAEDARDTRVLRRALALSREMLQVSGSSEPKREAKPEVGASSGFGHTPRPELTSKENDLRKTDRGGLDERKPAEQRPEDVEAEDEEGDSRPSWSRDEKNWVPKPIGVV